MGLTKAAYTRACRTVERAENSGFVAFEEAFGDDQRALARAIGYVEDGPDSSSSGPSCGCSSAPR